jgi:hypothetical protein
MTPEIKRKIMDAINEVMLGPSYHDFMITWNKVWHINGGFVSLYDLLTEWGLFGRITMAPVSYGRMGEIEALFKDVANLPESHNFGWAAGFDGIKHVKVVEMFSCYDIQCNLPDFEAL